MAIGSPEDLFDANDLIKDLHGGFYQSDKMILLRQHQQQAKLNSQKRAEEKQMAMSRMSDLDREYMISMLRYEYTEIYDYKPCHREIRMRNARDEARIRQMQMQAPMIADNQLDALRHMRQFIEKQKKLTILEQLQADVNVWLKGSLNPT